MMVTTERCKAMVYPNDQCGSFHPHGCQKKAVKDGFCTIHHPDYVKARDEERRQKWHKQNAAQQEAWRAERRKNEAYPLLLQALKSILRDLPTNRDWLDPDIERLAKEAVAKAEA